MKRVTKLFQLARIFSAPTTDSVHFHQGPQGQPNPCYDEACPMPRLAAEDTAAA
jgi:hypothetical protein